MTRRTAALALVLPLLLAVGCGGGDDGTARPAATPTSTPSVAEDATPTTTDTAAPLPSPSASTTGTAAATAANQPTPVDVAEVCGSTRIPDGTWTGPITFTVEGNGDQATFETTKEVGTLTVTAADERVTDGDWRMGFHSVGVAETEQARAVVTIDAKLSGAVTGTAAAPVVGGTWRFDGEAKVTRPMQTQAPFDEDGTVQGKATVRATSCDKVTVAFTRKLVSKAAQATFVVTARWVGTRQD